MSESGTLAQYHERVRGLTDRKLELFADRVRIRGTVRGTRLDVTVMLNQLQPSANRFWIRTKHFHWSAATLAILTPFLVAPFSVWPPNMPLLLFGMICYLPAVAYFVRSLKQYEFAVFYNLSGVHVLDLWHIGPDAESFDNFVMAVEAQIREFASGRNQQTSGTTSD